MKKFPVLAAVVFLALCLLSCTGPAGPTGPEGPEGPTIPGLYYARIFQQGVYTSTYTGQVQTSLRNLQSGAYYTNANNPINLGPYVAGEIYRGIVKFDLSSLPSTKVIVDKAELILKTNTADEGGGAVNVETHKVTSPWVVFQAGWQNSSSSTSWISLSGGDFSANTITPNALSYDFYPSSTIIIPLDPETVQGWLTSPTTNYGMLFKCANESLANYSEIYSSGAAVASNRPMLKVWYYTTE